MRRISDIGAAVIGSGFIGTVHIEALRRLGVRVHGLLEVSPEHGREARRRARAAPAPTPTWTRCSPTSGSRSSTSPRPTRSTSRRSRGSSPRASTSSARSRWPRRRRSPPSWCASRPTSRASSTPSTSTSASTRSTSTCAQLVADGALGEVRLVTGHYFQDWLLLDTDWNWRLDPAEGGSAAGRRRHRLPLARPHELRRRPPGRERHGRPRDVRQGPPPAGRPRRDLLHRAAPRTRSPARWSPTTRRRSCSASRAAPAARWRSRR